MNALEDGKALAAAKKAEALRVFGKVSKRSKVWRDMAAQEKWLIALESDDYKYKRSNSKRTAWFVRDHERITVDTTRCATKAEALAQLWLHNAKTFEENVRALAVRKEKQARAARRKKIAILNRCMNAHRAVINTAHHNRVLRFARLDEAAFNADESILLHQSPTRHGKRGSSYWLSLVNGQPAYVRWSDHWGKFPTIGLNLDGTRSNNRFARRFLKMRRWNLDGLDRNDTKRRAGYISIADLVAAFTAPKIRRTG